MTRILSGIGSCQVLEVTAYIIMLVTGGAGFIGSHLSVSGITKNIVSVVEAWSSIGF
jgi:hypothetical protein